MAETTAITTVERTPAKTEKQTRRETLISRLTMGLGCSAIVTVAMNTLGIKKFIVWGCAIVAAWGGANLEDRAKETLAKIKADAAPVLDKAREALDAEKKAVERAKEEARILKEKAEAIKREAEELREKAVAVKEKVEAVAENPLARMAAGAALARARQAAANAESEREAQRARKEAEAQRSIRLENAKAEYAERLRNLQLDYIGMVGDGFGQPYAFEVYQQRVANLDEQFRRYVGQ